MDYDLIPLADAIAALREQLNRAREAGEHEALRFEVGPIEVEFKGVVEREGSVGGKVGFKIFGFGSEATAAGKLGDARTQTVKITLTPKRNDRILDVSDREDLAEPSAGGG
jgi:hypothetical protein